MKAGLLIALLVAVTGQILYHVTQKMVASGANPVLSLMVFYGVAAFASLPLFWLFPMNESLAVETARLNWAVIGVAISIVLIEIGFLLAYRAGGELSTSFVMTAAVVAISTLVVGAIAFGETITTIKVAGIVLCLAGIGLLSSRTVH